ncbi:MAG: plasmid mobilization protein [Gemmatimonadota bacterium]
MELSKKTTILLTPKQHEHLTRLAEKLGLSLGELVRRACEERYGTVSEDDRLEAVRELAELSLPVGDASEMARESVPDLEDLGS